MRRSKGNYECWAGKKQKKVRIGQGFKLVLTLNTLFETCLLNLNELKIIHLKPLLPFFEKN
jgi:hypothetical protein